MYRPRLPPTRRDTGVSFLFICKVKQSECPNSAFLSFLSPPPWIPLSPYIIRQKWDTAKEEGLDYSGFLTSLPPSHFLVPHHCAHCHLKDAARMPMLVEQICQRLGMVLEFPNPSIPRWVTGIKGAVVCKPRLPGDFPNTSTQWPYVTVLLISILSERIS